MKETLKYIADLRPGDVIVSNGPGEIVVEREAPPVPALPQEPYTVIRVTWKPQRAHETASEYVLTSGSRNGTPVWECVDVISTFTPEELTERITGFEVLAEPVTEFDTDREVFERRVRRETAKAVLASVGAAMREQQQNAWSAPDLLQVAREFGVEVSS